MEMIHLSDKTPNKLAEHRRCVVRGRKKDTFSTLSSTSEGAKGKRKKVLIALAPSKENLDFATCHKPFIFLRLMAGTTGLEPATSAVTARKDIVTY